MRKINSKDVCSYKYASALDKSWRHKLQNPSVFLKPYIKQGMSVLDMGCGNGFCTLDIACLLEGKGKIVAADLQQEMLDLIEKKMNNRPEREIITLHKCESTSIGLSEKFDFILMFYMFHEMPEKRKALEQLKEILNSNGRILIIEPKFHVSNHDFIEEKNIVIESGLDVIDGPKIFFSRSMLIKK